MNFLFWRIATFIALLLPFVLLVVNFFNDKLGANPVEALTHETGKWALISLLTSLTVTPAMQLSGYKKLMLLRRMLGLYAFFYASMHFLIYWVFDQSLSLQYLWEDIADRPYITVGFFAWLLLIPLAVTSTQRWRKKLARAWIRLHKLVYIIAILALVHFIWMIRADYSEVIWYGIYLAILLAYRLVRTYSPQLHFQRR